MGSRPLARGAVAGGVATAVMSAVMLAAQRLRLMGRQPPSRVAEAALDAGGDKRPSRTATKSLAVASHFAFGSACGAGYALAVDAVDREPGPLGGGAFGLLIWATSYIGWLPGLGIMPPPSKDRPGRPTAMVVAHLVYGATLGALSRRRTPLAPRTRRALGWRARRATRAATTARGEGIARTGVARGMRKKQALLVRNGGRDDEARTWLRLYGSSPRLG